MDAVFLSLLSSIQDTGQGGRGGVHLGLGEMFLLLLSETEFLVESFGIDATVPSDK
jgi:hypothetical protein